MAERRSSDAGVTLIEVLVVLTLIAVGAGVVTLALPDRASERSLAQEADLLVSRLNLAAERSLVEGRTFRLAWTGADYGFATWQETGWQASKQASLPARHDLDAGVTLSALSGTGAHDMIIGPDLLPPQDGPRVWRFAGEGGSAELHFDGLNAAREAGS